MIIILGMAGAGKSTQCSRLAERDGYQWFSVGQYLRSIEKGEARAEMMKGKVLDDTIVTPIVEAELARLGDSPEILLDGCPRTVGQARWLASQVSTPKVRYVLHLVVDDETAMERLLRRGREDDSEDAMRRRFAGYHRDIQPVLEEFRLQNIKVLEVDARGNEEEVYTRINQLLSGNA
jgi:adenylate kinase